MTKARFSTPASMISRNWKVHPAEQPLMELDRNPERVVPISLKRIELSRLKMGAPETSISSPGALFALDTA